MHTKYIRLAVCTDRHYLSSTDYSNPNDSSIPYAHVKFAINYQLFNLAAWKFVS